MLILLAAFVLYTSTMHMSNQFVHLAAGVVVVMAQLYFVSLHVTCPPLTQPSCHTPLKHYGFEVQAFVVLQHVCIFNTCMTLQSCSRVAADQTTRSCCD